MIELMGYWLFTPASLFLGSPTSVIPGSASFHRSMNIPPTHTFISIRRYLAKSLIFIWEAGAGGFQLPVASYKGTWPSTMFIDDFVYFIHDTHGPGQSDDDLLVVRNASIGFIPNRSFRVLNFQHPLRTCRTT